MQLDWSQAYNYVYVAETQKKPQSDLTEVIAKIEKRVRKMESISRAPHLGQNLDTYA